MIAERFMIANPYPPNGGELNKQLYRLYLSTSDETIKKMVYDKVVSLNARLIGTVRHRNNYLFMSEGELMSLYGEAVLNSLRNFDLEYIERPSAIGNHIIIHMRALVGMFVHQDANLIKLPPRVRKGGEHLGVSTDFRHINVDEFSNIIGLPDTENCAINLEDFFKEYEKSIFNTREKLGLKYVKMSLSYKITEISYIEGKSTYIIQDAIKLSRRKMKQFAKRHK